MAKPSKVVILKTAAQYKDLPTLLGHAPLQGEQQKTAFVFASNSTLPRKNLFSRYHKKYMDPQALSSEEKVAALASDVGMASLGLPFHQLLPVQNLGPIPEIVKDAVADLWRAAGRGISLIIAFDEKSWAGNPALLDYYRAHVELLRDFLESKKKLANFRNNAIPLPCQQAYLEGFIVRKGGYQLSELEAGSELETKPELRAENKIYYRIEGPEVVYVTKLMKQPTRIPRNQLLNLDGIGQRNPRFLKALKKDLLAHTEEEKKIRLIEDKWFEPDASRGLVQGSKNASKALHIQTRVEGAIAEAKKRSRDRLWLAASLLLGIIGIIPVYFFWYRPERAKEKNEVVRIAPMNMALLNEFRRRVVIQTELGGFLSQLSGIEGADKPSKIMPDKFTARADKEASYIMDPEQARRHYFWVRLQASGKTTLTKDERADLDRSVKASTAIMARK